MKLSEPNKRILNKLWKNKLTVVSAFYILLCIIISIFAYQIIPDKSKNANTQNIEIAIKKPGFKVDMLTIDSVIHIPLSEYNKSNDTLFYVSYDGDEGFTTSSNYKIQRKRYIFGTDKFGRDVFSRLILGTRVSLSIGIIAVILSLVIGVFLGAIAGYFRGKTDKFIMWLINVVWSIPSVLLVIAISFALGRGFWQVFVAVGLSLWVDVARLVRGQVISIKEQEYVDGAKTLGFSSTRIITKHILPNIVSPLLVISASNFASAILLEAGLSFLGIGVQPPMASWGTMIKESYAYLILGDAYLSLLPGIAIVLMVLAFMLLGNGLRDALDVK
ncbi:ABC transporter permease [Odoribacter sp. OttesenSCG-928-L07]|nr:ABC transporter permease [Odoribacter sp. OttesenSCG-928-L07]MDL2240436.1 ABC transporter permease [Bacteroidales bacterium OttesenSCG-928-K22]